MTQQQRKQIIELGRNGLPRNGYFTPIRGDCVEVPDSLLDCAEGIDRLYGLMFEDSQFWENYSEILKFFLRHHPSDHRTRFALHWGFYPSLGERGWEAAQIINLLCETNPDHPFLERFLRGKYLIGFHGISLIGGKQFHFGTAGVKDLKDVRLAKELLSQRKYDEFFDLKFSSLSFSLKRTLAVIDDPFLLESASKRFSVPEGMPKNAEWVYINQTNDIGSLEEIIDRSSSNVFSKLDPLWFRFVENRPVPSEFRELLFKHLEWSVPFLRQRFADNVTLTYLKNFVKEVRRDPMLPKVKMGKVRQFIEELERAPQTKSSGLSIANGPETVLNSPWELFLLNRPMKEVLTAAMDAFAQSNEGTLCELISCSPIRKEFKKELFESETWQRNFLLYMWFPEHDWLEELGGQWQRFGVPASDWPIAIDLALEFDLFSVLSQAVWNTEFDEGTVWIMVVLYGDRHDMIELLYELVEYERLARNPIGSLMAFGWLVELLPQCCRTVEKLVRIISSSEGAISERGSEIVLSSYPTSIEGNDVSKLLKAEPGNSEG